MAFDALTLSVLRDELRQTLTGGKITKVYQPERDEIVLFVFNKQTYKLLISANANVNRIHLTEMPTDNPKVAPSFCMLLRKHIVNAVITDIKQVPYERVLEFCLEVSDELGYKKKMQLIFELTGKTSNVILTDEKYTVLDSIKHLPQDINASRIIMAGAKYAFFAPQNKIEPFDLPRVREYLASCNLPLRKTLPEVLLGVSQSTVNEILYGLDENDHGVINNAAVVEGLTAYKFNLEHKKPNVVTKNGAPVDVCPFDYRSKKGDKVFFETLNQAHDNYFYLLDRAQRFADKAKSVSTIVKNAVSRTEKKLAAQRQALLEAENRDVYRQYGDLILSNLHIPAKDSLTCLNYYDGTTVTIPLDPRLSPQQNAQAYYRKYRKLKSSYEHNGELVKENAALLEYLLTIKENLRYCTDPDDLQQIKDELTLLGLLKEQRAKAKPVPVKPLRYEIEGYTVYVGKNNVQNNYVTFKLASAQDVWLHTQKIHSSHAVIVAQNGEVPDSVIEKAAQICAYYSQARESDKVPVDYTRRCNVKKPSKAPLGFVVYNSYRTVLVTPDRLPQNLL